MIFYNKDLFKKAGLDPENPKLAHLRRVPGHRPHAGEVRSRGQRHLAGPGQRVLPVLVRLLPASTPPKTGGTQLVEDGKATFNSDQGKQVATMFWQTLYKENLASQGGVPG